MNSHPTFEHDLIVVGAGPTGIAIGARARQRSLDVVLIDRGPLAASLAGFPTNMQFFTTNDLLEIADIPFTIAHDKPSRQEALVYYRSVAERYQVPVATHEEVVDITPHDGGFEVRSQGISGERSRTALAVALATGYFHRPRRLGVPGESADWAHHRYYEPYRHYREHVVVVGGGNSAVEVALELWRNQARVTLVHRGSAVKETVKYWLKPDLENRIAEGSIAARFNTVVKSFGNRTLTVESGESEEEIDADAAYVLVGYEPEVEFQRRCGIAVDPQTLEPECDPATCESNVPGIYVAGTLQAGRDLGRIFIENSRVHADRIVEHLAKRLDR